MGAIMGSIDFAMVHSCKILRDTGTTQDTAGTPIPNLVSTDSKCLFENVSSAGNYIAETDAGPVILYSILCSLPTETVVQEGDYISTTERVWAGTYRVEHVDAPEIPGSEIIDHLEAFLKRADKRG
jgi:uncharacterized protein (DUF1499 family)